MAFKVKLALLKIKAGNGINSSEIVESKLVWANVSDVGVNTKINAESVGAEVTLQAVTYRSSAENFTHVDYKGTRYKIEKTGKAENDLHIVLILARVK